MSLFTMRAIQGQATTYTLTLSVSTFVGTETLTAAINTGGTAAALLTLTPTWTSGQTTNAYGRVDITLSAANTAALAPDFYVISVAQAAGGGALAYGLLEIVSAAGQTPTQDWLITPARVLGLVPDLAADITTLADLPRVIAATSDHIRKYCNRWFTRRTVTKEYQVALDGTIRLDDIPVNSVSRIGTTRSQVMTITGSTTAFQLARVTVTTTGDYASGLVVTGLTLTSTASGVSTSTALLFSTYVTLSTLAAAINAVSGWTATVNSGYSLWPTAELSGLTTGQGVLGGGAYLMAYVDDAAAARVDHDGGFLYLGFPAGSSSLNTPAWGPDWGQWITTTRRYPTTAKVTYDAGYDTVPEAVVMAAAETIQDVYNRLATNQIVKQSTIGDYSYTLRDSHGFLPDGAKASLSTYRIHNA